MFPWGHIFCGKTLAHKIVTLSGEPNDIDFLLEVEPGGILSREWNQGVYQMITTVLKVVVNGNMRTSSILGTKR